MAPFIPGPEADFGLHVYVHVRMNNWMIYVFVVVILTDDGASSNQHQLVKEAEKTKNQGITLMVIGVGDETNEEALVSVASHHRLYTASSYEALGRMGVRISVMLCQGL